MMDSAICPKGDVEIIIKNRDGEITNRYFTNTVLKKGKEALAASLANSFGNSYNFFVNRMFWGDGGTQGGVPKYVNASRTGLFGFVRAIKPVIATIDPVVRSQVVFTSVLDYDDANGYTLNEMALEMNNGDLYSLATFEDLSKTSNLSLTYNWRISYL